MESFEALRDEWLKALDEAQTESEVLELKGRFVGKKRGKIQDLLMQLKSAPPEERPLLGQAVNKLKGDAEAAIEAALKRVRAKRTQLEPIDVTLPGLRPNAGHLHPITRVRREIEDIFVSMGYAVAMGPEVEDPYHNFEALNTPADHPSRDIQDTFYLEGGLLLRTQTSPVQIRTMESRRPPIKIIAPGRVFRRDDDVSHSPMFFQVEGLVVDRGITMSDLKGTLLQFYRSLFQRDVNIRFRPSYFPFTEPSAETDLSCVICSGAGCPVCKRTGWLEVGGCGMVDPAVFASVGYDPEEYSGFAFGLGIDRMAMLKYGIDNIKYFYENDLAFLEQF
ncbi:MAG: phenylalanine--tRNA ligase subunit alpha [Acidobacteria bacterium]|jgi:phenylalanyl-tRNA synthetase alpha chain|nr:phenylalanine--tRNA ligase subunit alpha [Acidobacteriota bacterium]